jgi:hypothetical protein
MGPASIKGRSVNHNVSRRGAAGRVDALFGSEASGRFPPSKIVTGFAIGALLAALLANEFLAARFLSADGLLDATTMSTLRWVQAALFKRFDPSKTPENAMVVRDFGNGLILFRRNRSSD